MGSHFLLTFNRKTGALTTREFPGENGGREALHARFTAEKETVDPDVEIVTIQANDLDTIKRTHSRYFSTIPELAADLAAAAS